MIAILEGFGSQGKSAIAIVQNVACPKKRRYAVGILLGTSPCRIGRPGPVYFLAQIKSTDLSRVISSASVKDPNFELAVELALSSVFMPGSSMDNPWTEC